MADKMKKFLELHNSVTGGNSGNTGSTQNTSQQTSSGSGSTGSRKKQKIYEFQAMHNQAKRIFSVTGKTDGSEDFVFSFLRDSQDYLRDSVNNLNRLTWSIANDPQKISARTTAADTMRQRAADVRSYLEENKSDIDPDKYDYFMSYLRDFGSDMFNLSREYENGRKYYSQFDSEDDYNSYRYFTNGDKRSAEELIAASNAGLSAYERDRVAAFEYENSDEGKWDRWVSRMAEAPLAEATPMHYSLVNQYRADDSYKQMNDRWSKGQRLTFGYLYEQDPEKATQYAIQVNNSLNSADKDAQRQIAVDIATSGFLPGVAETGKAIVGGMTGIGDYFNDVAEYQARGIVTERGNILTPAEYASSVTSGISEHLNSKFGTISESVPVFGGKGVGDLYSLGASVAQSMLSGHMLGKSGTLLTFFGSAAASTADDARSRGATDEQALALGTLAGIAEGAAEMIGVDNLFKLGASDTFRGFLRNTFRQGISEGVEEGLTSLFNNISEDIVMGENSKFYDLVDAYVQGGLTPEEAKKKAWVDCVEEMLFDAAGGFASGNVSGGMETVIQTGSRNRAARRNLTDSAQELVTEGLQAPEGSKYYQMASDAQKRLDAGKSLSGGQLYRLQSANEQQMLNSDTQTIQKAVAARLTELGETGDIAGISAAIAKQVSTEAAGSALPYQAHYLNEITDRKNRDIRAEISHERFLETSQQKLSNAERRLISESKFGQRVLNELNTQNIRSGNYSADWTGNIGTESLNAAEYGRNLKAAEATSEEKIAVPQSQNRPVTSEPKAVKTPEANTPTSKFEQVQAKAKASGKEATIEDYASAYGKQSKAVMAVYELGEGKQDPAKFAEEYEMVYNWGASGISESFAMNPANQVKNSVLTDAQRLKAYQIGKLAAADSAKALTARNGITGRTASNWKKGVLKGHGVAVSEVEKAFAKHNGKQVKAIRVLRNLAEVTGIDIVLYKSSAGSDGFLRGETIDGVDLSDAQGAFAWKNDKLYIDINAGLENAIDFGDVAKYTMLRTFGHEFTHFCEKWNPEEYNSFRQLVFDHMERKGENVHALIEAKQEAGMSYEEASREVVAEAMTDILPETSFAQELAQKHQNLFQKLLEKLKEFLNDIKEYFNGLAGNLDPGAEALKTEIDGTMRYLEDIVKAYDQLAIHAVENYQVARENVSNQSSAQEMSNEEAFLDSETAVQNQIRPPYSDGSKAFNTFAEGLRPEARKTFGLFYGFYQRSRITNTMSVSGKRVKAVNISSLYLMAQDWNTMLANEPKWAAAAKDLAEFLPADVRKRMNMNADGTLIPSTMEKEFKMPSSLAQRLVDALPYESIDARYQLGDKTITLPEGKARQSVGGEAYRRAILTETRKLFAEGKLRPVGIGTMSKDRWGSLGFLAANGKTGASGDFTTVCPQMMFNRGCWYCYRRAAMEKGVNNKLVAQNVWYTGEILRIKDSDIAALNKNGGLRIQSFGDWMPHFSAMLADVLYDAELRGLQVKIITKEPSMINYIASLREQGIGKNLYFNLSSDYTIERGPARQIQGGDSLDAVNPERPYMRDQDNSFWWKRAMSVEEASRYREKYPWVNTRIVATDVEEFIRGLKDIRVDVVTGYHGNIRGIERVDSTTGARKIEVEALGDAGMPRFAFNPVTGQWVTEYEGKTATHKRLAQAIADNGLQMEYYTKTCCITGRCASCNGKCGALARDFNVKNATNRDAESVAYWQQHMEYAVEPEFGDMTVEQDQDRRQYQIRQIGNTGKFYVQADRQVLSGTDPDMWGKQIENYINEEIRKNQDIAFPTQDGHILLLTGRSAYKLKDRHVAAIKKKAEDFLSDTDYQLKGRAATHIDELIQIARFDKYEPDKDGKHENDIGEDGFNYFKSYFRDFDGKYYEIPLTSALNEDEETAYSIGKPRQRRFPAGPGSSSSTEALNNGRKPSGDIIYSSSDKSQEKSAFALAYEAATQKSQHQKRTNSLSDREVLEYAAMRAEFGNLTDGERDALRIFQQRLDKLRDLQVERERMGSLWHDQQFGGGDRSEATKSLNRMHILDSQIERAMSEVLSIEDKKVLQRVLKKARGVIRDEEASKHRATIQRRRDSSKEAELRFKIHKTVNDLNRLLLRGDKKHHVPEGLKKAVADALEAINMADSITPEALRKAAADELARLYPQLQAAIAEKENARFPEDARLASSKILMIQNQIDAAERKKNRNDKLLDRLKALRDAYDEIAKEDDPDFIYAYDVAVARAISDAIESIGDVPLNDLTLPQLEKVYDVYKMVMAAVRNANKSFIQGKTESMDQLIRKTIGEVRSAGGAHDMLPTNTEDLRKFFWNNQKPVYAMERIGSNTFMDTFWSLIDGEGKYARDVQDAFTFYDSLRKKHGYDKWNFDKKYSFESTGGTTFNLTLEQILSLYAYSKREQAHDHLRLGGFVFDSAIETHKEKDGKKSIRKYKVNVAKSHQIDLDTLTDIISTLTAEQKAFADEMQAYLSNVMGAKGNEVSMAMYDVKLFKEKNYFPLKSAKQFMFEQNETAGEVRIKNSSFTHKLTPGANNPVILSNFLDVWANHVHDMSMYHAFALPVEDFNRIFNGKTRQQEGIEPVAVKSVIQEAYGPEAVNYLKQLITDLNGGARSDPRESTAKARMGRFKKGAVFASTSVVIQQPSAIIRARAMVDSRFFDINPRLTNHKKLWNEVKQYAPVAILKEMGHFDMDTGRSTVDYIKNEKSFMDKVDDKLSIAPAWADEWAWVQMWAAVKKETAAKNKGLATNSEEFLKLAGKRFTEIIVKTQVYDSTLSRSANMRSKSGLMVMATAFMAEPTTSINMLEYGMRELKRGNKKTAVRYFTAVYGSMLVNSLLVSLVYAMRDDDEDETFLEKYFSSVAAELLDGIIPLTYYPWVKDAWSILQGYDVERSDMTIVADVADAFKKLFKTISIDTSNMDQDEISDHKHEVAAAWWELMEVSCTAMGMPVKNIRRDVMAVFNLVKTLSGDLENTPRSFWDEIEESLRNTLPVIGWLPGESKTDRLYDAIVSGDTGYEERILASYEKDTEVKTQNAIKAARRKALKENDPRITEAAEAYLDGDVQRYMDLIREIRDEGHWVFDEIMAAFESRKSEIEQIRGLSEESEFKPDTDNSDTLFDMDYYVNTVIAGNSSSANTIRRDMLQYMDESEFESKFKNSLKGLFEDENITASTAQKLLVSHGGMDQADAKKTVSEWEFKAEYGFNWTDRADAYRDGLISAEEMKRLLINIGGKSAEEADLQIEVYDWQSDGIDIESDQTSVVERYRKCESYGISRTMYVDFYNFYLQSGTEGVTNTKVNDCMPYINSLNLTPAQKTALALSIWSERTVNRNKLW